MSMFPSQQRQKLLVFGYVRESSNVNIPMVLTKLCESFYNKYVYWHFEGKPLDKLLSMNDASDKLYNKKPITINNITFDCVIDVNTIHFPANPGPRQSRWIKTFMTFGFEAIKYPQSISNITLYYKYHCPQMNIFKEKISLLYPTSDPLETVSEWRVYPGLPIKKTIKKKKESKTFICDIDIMEIQYNDNSKIYRKSNIFLKANTNYEFKIDELPTEKIIRKYFDNNNWCVSYYKKGISRNEYNHSFALEILALPSNVKTIKVKMTKYVRYFQNSYKWKKNSEVIYEFSYRHNQNH
eukprot:124617_1